jgi:hypothetical protein
VVSTPAKDGSDRGGAYSAGATAVSDVPGDPSRRNTFNDGRNRILRAKLSKHSYQQEKFVI